MLSFFSCVGCRYCRFSPFASFRSFHITLFEHGIAQNHVSFTNARLCFAQAPWYTFEIHVKINTKTSWRHEEDMYNVDHTQKANNPLQRAHQSQTPRPTQPSAPSTAKSHAQPSPARLAEPHSQIRRPTQPSTPSRAKSTPSTPPNPAQHAQHGQIARPTQPSPARPARPNPRPAQHSAPTSASSLFFLR